MWKATKIIALDQHMDTTTVGVADAGRRAPELYGDIPSTPKALRRLVRASMTGRVCASATRRARVAMGCIGSSRRWATSARSWRRG